MDGIIRSRSITPKNKKDINQGLLHLWSKFGAPSLNGWWVIARTNTWLPHMQTDGRTHRQTDAGNDNTRRPKLASGEKLYDLYFKYYFDIDSIEATLCQTDTTADIKRYRWTSHDKIISKIQCRKYIWHINLLQFGYRHSYVMSIRQPMSNRYRNH